MGKSVTEWHSNPGALKILFCLDLDPRIPGGYVTSSAASISVGGSVTGQGYRNSGGVEHVGQVRGVPVMEAPPLTSSPTTHHPPRTSSRPSSPTTSAAGSTSGPTSPSAYTTARSASVSSFSARALSPQYHSGNSDRDSISSAGSDLDDLPRFQLPQFAFGFQTPMSPTSPRSPSPLRPPSPTTPHAGVSAASSMSRPPSAPVPGGAPRINVRSPDYSSVHNAQYAAASAIPLSYLSSVGIVPTRSPPRSAAVPVPSVAVGANELHPDARLLREDPRALETGRQAQHGRTGRRGSGDRSSYPPPLGSYGGRSRSPERSSLASAASLHSLSSSLASPYPNPVDFRDAGAVRSWLSPGGNLRRSDTQSSRGSMESGLSGLSGLGSDATEGGVGRGMDGLREVLSRRDDRLTHLLRLVEDLDEQLTTTLTRLASSESDRDVLELQLGDAKRHEIELRKRLEALERDTLARAEDRRALEVESAQMRVKLTSLEDQKSEADSISRTLRLEVAALTMRLASKKEEAEELKAAVAKAEADLAKATAEVEKRGLQIETLEAERTAAEAERDTKAAELEIANAERERMERARAEAEAMSSIVAQKLDTEQAKVAEMEANAAAVAAEHEAARAGRAMAERGLKDASERAEAHRVEAERAARDAAEQGEARAELEKKLAQLKEEMAEGERNQAEFAEAMRRVEEERDGYRGVVGTMTERIEVLAGKLSELEKVADERAVKAREVEAALASAVAAAAGLEADKMRDLNEAHQVAENARFQFEASLAKVQQLEADLVTMKSAIQEKDKKFLELQSALQEALEGKAAAEGEMAVLAQRISVMDEAEEARTALMNELEDRLRREEDSGRERHLVMATLRATLDRQSYESNDREAEIDRLRDELQAKEVIMAQREDDLLALRATVGAQAKAMEETRLVVVRLERVVEESDRKMREEEAKGIQREALIDKLRGDLEESAQKELALQVKLDGVTADLADNSQKLAEQLDTVAALQATIASQSTTINNMQGLIDNLESAVAVAKERLASSEAAALEKDAIIQTLRETIERETPLGIALRSDLARRNIELAEKSNKLDVRDKEVASLAESLSAHARELDDLRQRVVVLQEVGPSKDARIGELETFLRERDASAQSAFDRIAALNATVEQQLETIATQTRSLEKLAALELELAHRQQRLDAMENDFTTSQRNLSDHGSQLKQLTVELEDERSRREKLERSSKEQATAMELQAGELVRLAMLGNAVAEKERLVLSLEKDNADRAKDLEKARIEVQELVDALAEEKAGALELESKLREAQEQIFTLRSSFSELQSSNESLRSERDALLATTRGKDLQLLELSAEKTALEEALATLDIAKQDAERSAEVAESKLAATLEERAKWQDILAQLDAAREKQGATEAELANFKASLTAAVDENTRTKVVAQSEIAGLKTSLATQTEKVSELESKLQESLTNLEKIQSNQSFFEIQLSVLRTERDALSRDVRDKQVQIDRLEADKNTLLRAVETLEAHRVISDRQLTESSTRTESLLTDLETAREGWKAADQARYFLQQNYTNQEDLRRQLEESKMAAASRQRDITENEKRLAEISREKARAESEALQLGKQLETAKATVANLEAAVAARDRTLNEQAQTHASQTAMYEQRLQDLQGKVNQQDFRNMPPSSAAPTARSAHLLEQIQKLQAQLDESVKEKVRLQRLAEVAARGGSEAAKWRELDEAHRENERLRVEVENLREGRRNRPIRPRLGTSNEQEGPDSRSASPDLKDITPNVNMEAQTDLSAPNFERHDATTQDNLSDPKPDMVSFGSQATVEIAEMGSQPDAVAAALSTEELMTDFELQQSAHLSRLALLEAEIAEKEKLIKELQNERNRHSRVENSEPESPIVGNQTLRNVGPQESSAMIPDGPSAATLRDVDAADQGQGSPIFIGNSDLMRSAMGIRGPPTEQSVQVTPAIPPPRSASRNSAVYNRRAIDELPIRKAPSVDGLPVRSRRSSAEYYADGAAASSLHENLDRKETMVVGPVVREMSLRGELGLSDSASRARAPSPDLSVRSTGSYRSPLPIPPASPPSRSNLAEAIDMLAAGEYMEFMTSSSGLFAALRGSTKRRFVWIDIATMTLMYNRGKESKGKNKTKAEFSDEEIKDETILAVYSEVPSKEKHRGDESVRSTSVPILVLSTVDHPIEAGRGGLRLRADSRETHDLWAKTIKYLLTRRALPAELDRSKYVWSSGLASYNRNMARAFQPEYAAVNNWALTLT
ncbi:hypothetical protein HDU93_003178 [Gonapodya sp. JEL0774]|nr:hypothetical protein HDU93_003178 [Gonapodya sp. JEL0774]